MVGIPDRLECLFTALVEEDGDSHSIEIPREELEMETISAGETYRVVILGDTHPIGSESQQDETPAKSMASSPPSPPISTGDVREVTIETLGDQGDGIAKIQRGYVLIVPGARPDDEVIVEITDVRQNVAFAEVHGHPNSSERR